MMVNYSSHMCDISALPKAALALGGWAELHFHLINLSLVSQRVKKDTHTHFRSAHFLKKHKSFHTKRSRDHLSRQSTTCTGKHCMAPLAGRSARLSLYVQELGCNYFSVLFLYSFHSCCSSLCWFYSCSPPHTHHLSKSKLVFQLISYYFNVHTYVLIIVMYVLSIAKSK